MAGTLSELTAAGRRLAGLALEVLADRLELAGLELREAKIRLIQYLLLALVGVALLLGALALAVLAVMLALPPQWRLVAAGTGAVAFLVCGCAVLIGLRRRLVRRPPAFARTIEELQKDRECF